MLDDRKSDVIYSVIPVRGVVYNQVVKIVISKRSDSIDLIEHLLHLDVTPMLRTWMCCRCRMAVTALALALAWEALLV